MNPRAGTAPSRPGNDEAFAGGRAGRRGRRITRMTSPRQRTRDTAAGRPAPRSVQRVRLRQVREGSIRFAVERVERPKDVWDAVRGYYRGADREILSALYLDASHAPVCFHVIAVGSRNAAHAAPADVLKPALLANASALVLVHNHPSDRLEPSPEDIALTASIRRACDLLGVRLLDHLVVGDSGFVSLRERGLLGARGRSP